MIFAFVSLYFFFLLFFLFVPFEIDATGSAKPSLVLRAVLSI